MKNNYEIKNYWGFGDIKSETYINDEKGESLQHYLKSNVDMKYDFYNTGSQTPITSPLKILIC